MLRGFLTSVAPCLVPAFVLPAQAATPPGVEIVNTATATYTHEGRNQQLQATVGAKTVLRTPARIDFLLGVDPAVPGLPPGVATQVNAGACRQGGTWQTQTTAQSVFAGTLSLPQELRLSPARVYVGRDAAFVRVIDPDQNLNPLLPDTVEVTVTSDGDSETLRLTETGPSTGEFVGWVMLSHTAPVAGDCALSVSPGGNIVARYVDPQDASDTHAAAALVDPLGTVFNSGTGAPVDGAAITLMDAATGLPAQVFGDDGVSSYPATVLSGAQQVDSSGRIYPGLAGRYRFPFVRPGHYLLRVVPPAGLSFPSGVPDALLQTLPGAPYSLSEASRGASFPLVLGVLVTDIPLDPRSGSLLIRKEASRSRAAPGDFIRYTLSVTNKDQAPVNEVRIADVLPQGLRLRAGTARTAAGAVVPVEIGADGRSLVFSLGTLDRGATASIHYIAEVTVQAPLGAAVNLASVTGAGAVGSSARATVDIFDDLMASKAMLVGTVFVGSCPEAGEYPARTLRGARIVMHNGRFAVSGADGAWHLEGIDPGTNLVRLDPLSLPQGYRLNPCPQGSRGSAGGWAETVRALPGGLYRVNFFVEAPPGEALDPAPAGPPPKSAFESAEAAALASGDPASAWVWPVRESVPNTYSSLLVRHAPGATVKLRLNGAPVPGFHFEGTRHGEDGKTAVSYWRNVHLQAGANSLVALVAAPGEAEQRLERVLHVATAPARAELAPEHSRLIANGRDPVIVAVRLLDRDNQPVRSDISGDISLNAPYQMFDVLKGNLVNPLNGALDPAARVLPKYTVGADGIARLRIAPTTQAGRVEIGFRFDGDIRQTVTAQLLPENREWIVVGFAETSVIGRKLRETLRPVTGYAIDAHEIPGERAALFAKGVVPGDFLMTLAYDSAKPAIAPQHQDAQSETTRTEAFYVVYADNAQSGNEAPTDGRLYLKLEKSTFQLLWGNFNTGLTRADLARYDRSVYGLRSTWQGERWSYTAFAFENRTASQRDIIAADGTTGSYRLRRVPVLEQSERVKIVTRQRLDPVSLVEEHILSRQIDYTLDYPSGLLVLARPVPAADIHGNPIRIEIDYESKDAVKGRDIAGGRVALQITPQTELGLSLILDGDLRLGGQLGALDLRSELAPGTTVQIEAGSSRRKDPAGLRTLDPGLPAGADNSARGQAFSAEIKHQDGDTQLRAYGRSAARGYGLPDQTGVQTGVRSVGVEWRQNLTPQTRLEVSARQQSATDTSEQSRAAEARLSTQEGGWQLGAGARWAEEQNAAASQTRFGQALASAAYTAPDQRWTLRGSTEMAIHAHEALQYPDRIALSAEYRFTSDLAGIASHEWLRDKERRTLSQAGLRWTPWAGATLQTTLAETSLLSGTEDRRSPANQTALRTQATQTLPLLGGWALDAQITHAQRLRGSPFEPQNAHSPDTSQAAYSPLSGPSALGTPGIDTAEHFFSAGLGLSYSSELWSGFARYEKIRADHEDRDNLALGITRPLAEGHHLLFSGRLERAEARQNARLSLQHAWRPPASPWTWLERLDWIDNRGALDALSEANRRIVYNTHLNYRSPRGWEINGHLGAKHLLERWDAQGLQSTLGIVGWEGRVDVNDWLDVGLHGVMARSAQACVRNWGYGTSVGIRPVHNTQIEIGYNWRGITDRDFFANNQRAQGVYVNLRVLLDENLLGLGKPPSNASSAKP